MFGQINNYENKLFISGQEVLGVESVDVSYSNSSSISKLLGFEKGLTTVDNTSNQKVSISRNLIYEDPMMNYTGSNAIVGSINYNDNSYGFKSGYLDEYMVNCAVGSIPKVSTNITVHDELKSGINDASGSIAPPTIHVPNQGSISLSCDHSSTNRVVGFDYSLKVSRKPIYSIGSKRPTEIVLINPIEFSASVQVDVDDAFLQSGMSFLETRQNKTVVFTIKSNDNLLILQQLSIPNASLVGESLSSSADGGVKITLNYIGHL